MGSLAKLGMTAKTALVVVLFAGIVAAQYGYDLARTRGPQAQPSTPSLGLVRSVDLGLHATAASFLWIDTITELPFLRDGYPKFAADLKLINDLDPKFSFPYAFTVLVLPGTKYPDRVNETVRIGKLGVAQSEPDWRIPFYLAVTYHLELKDKVNAARYFDLAAQTPGAPYYIQRFSINYGIAPNDRERTRAVWQFIYEHSDEATTKERAKAYLARLDMFDYLDAAVKAYRTRYGAYPATLDELVAKRIIPELPKDPFGFEFVIDAGGVVGINKTKEQ